ncbi:MAG: uracil-DNA glycosylase family protein [Chromatiales bacterium]|jgi:uracil-DNA glycosylase
MPVLQAIQQHQQQLRQCRTCPDMIGPVVTGQAVLSPVMLIGQAPGDKEGPAGRPFAWTAGKTLFKWFESIGLGEASFRERVYMAAVCRCFPGKNPKGGDRVPSQEEIDNCRVWLEREIELLKPQLLIPVGKLAITQFLPAVRLAELVGQSHRLKLGERSCDLVPLPHPSGASTWHRTEPGKTLLQHTLALIQAHPAWQALLDAD